MRIIISINKRLLLLRLLLLLRCSFIAIFVASTAPPRSPLCVSLIGKSVASGAGAPKSPRARLRKLASATHAHLHLHSHSNQLLRDDSRFLRRCASFANDGDDVPAGDWQLRAPRFPASLRGVARRGSCSSRPSGSICALATLINSPRELSCRHLGANV